MSDLNLVAPSSRQRPSTSMKPGLKAGLGAGAVDGALPGSLGAWLGFGTSCAGAETTRKSAHAYAPKRASARDGFAYLRRAIFRRAVLLRRSVVPRWPVISNPLTSWPAYNLRAGRGEIEERRNNQKR